MRWDRLDRYRFICVWVSEIFWILKNVIVSGFGEFHEERWELCVSPLQTKGVLRKHKSGRTLCWLCWLLNGRGLIKLLTCLTFHAPRSVRSFAPRR